MPVRSSPQKHQAEGKGQEECKEGQDEPGESIRELINIRTQEQVT
jgi:hypothetical protein